MRPIILVLAAALLTAPAAMAAPTCQDRNGDTIRCGTQGAMPVGWTLSEQARQDRGLPPPALPTAREAFGLLCVIGGLFAIIALMPAFDGWREGDWDAQEGDEKRSR
jgi:hypothetical protein